MAVMTAMALEMMVAPTTARLERDPVVLPDEPPVLRHRGEDPPQRVAAGVPVHHLDLPPPSA